MLRRDVIGAQMEEDDEDEDEWAVTMVAGRRDSAEVAMAAVKCFSELQARRNDPCPIAAHHIHQEANPIPTKGYIRRGIFVMRWRM